MPLQLILGNSGSGKSHFLYKKVIEESIAHPEQNYMVIVPEQFTMQTQKDLVDMHRPGDYECGCAELSQDGPPDF